MLAGISIGSIAPSLVSAIAEAEVANVNLVVEVRSYILFIISVLC